MTFGGMSFSVLIVDPNSNSAKSLTKIIEVNFGQISNFEVATSPQEALQLLTIQEFQILIINISAQEHLELLNYISTERFKLIFTSDNMKKITETIDYLPIGYLRIPLISSQVKTILNRTIKDLMMLDVDESTFLINKANRKISILKREVIRCESDSNYTQIILSNKAQPVIISRTLKYVQENYLTSIEFVRVHKSHLVNRRFIVSDRIVNNNVQMINGDFIPISRARRKEVNTMLKGSKNHKIHII